MFSREEAEAALKSGFRALGAFAVMDEAKNVVVIEGNQTLSPDMLEHLVWQESSGTIHPFDDGHTVNAGRLKIAALEGTKGLKFHDTLKDILAASHKRISRNETYGIMMGAANGHLDAQFGKVVHAKVRVDRIKVGSEVIAINDVDAEDHTYAAGEIAKVVDFEDGIPVIAFLSNPSYEFVDESVESFSRDFRTVV
jgi:hypothetical protein